MLMMDLALTGAQQVGEHMTEPTDDWDPMLLMLNGDGKGAVVHLGDAPDRDAMLSAIPQVMRQFGAVEVALVLSSWMVDTPEPGFLESGMRASQHPDRIEALVVFGGREGEYRMDVYPIIRSGESPPTLGSQRDIDGYSVEGAFADVVASGFAA